MLTCLVAILLGVAALVAIRTVTVYSEVAVAREMDPWGPTCWCCPSRPRLQDYYAADMQGETIPEEYVTQLAMSDLEGLDNISPKLCVPVELGGRQLHAHRHPAQERVPGQGRLGRGGHLLAAHRLRGLASA